MKRLTFFKISFLCISLFIFQMLPHSQSINKVEYFVDTDPGFGNATSVTISSSADIASLIIPVNITSLPVGLHNVFFRTQDNLGYWSLTNHWLFFKDNTTANVTKVEYFVDSNPGFGNATNFAVTASGDIANLTIPVNVAALSPGLHNIFIRSQDNGGKWSITSHWLFFKDAAQTNLQSGEYFFDTDPGFGNGTAISFGGSLGTNVSDLSFIANTASLGNGSHYLFIRTLEANSRWSLTNVFPFTKSIALPVTLLNFTAVANGTKNLLNWQTTTEINNNRFEIEKSADGIIFNKIGSVSGAGNSSVLLNYLFEDTRPLSGTNYYRLKQIDVDEHSSFSPVRRLDFNSLFYFKLLNSSFAGTPVIVQTSEADALISVFDQSGRKLQEMKLPGNSLSIKTIGLSNGIYIVAMQKNGKVIAVERFVVNK